MKRLIATRLVQISLLVDDYVYHGKPMSARSAEAYIREITAFKDKCYQDVRSLQVSEKLIRIMKGIIEEQKEIHGQAGTEDFTFTYKDSLKEIPLSPVYSIAEEDTQYLEAFKENDKETVPDQITGEEDNDTQTTTDARDPIGTNDIQVIDLCDDENVHVSNDDTLLPRYSIVEEDLQNINDIIKELDKDSLPDKIVTDEKNYTKTATDPVVNMEVLDLCDNEIAEALTERNINGFHNEELNIQRGLSNLSIRDFEEVFEVPFSQECSQSILDNYYPQSIANGIGTPLTLNNASTVIVTQRPETDKVVFNDKTIKIALPQKNKQLNIKPTIIENTKNMQTGLKISKPGTQKPSNTRNKNKTLNALLETGATNVSDSVTIKKCTAKVTNTKPKAQKQKNVKAETVTKQFINEYKNDIQQPNIKQNANQHAPSEVGNRTHFDHPRHLQTTTKGIKNGDKCNVLINNSFVVNDLSWIQNIRFVREIPSEEYESLNEGKDFWKNCTFPQNYNEEDFNF